MLSTSRSPRQTVLHSLDTAIELPQAPEELFPFFSDAANLEAITPPELNFSITSPPRDGMGEGARIRYRLVLWGVAFRWETHIRVWEPPHYFVDEQVAGPFRRWEHHHILQATANGTRMLDHVDYALPMTPAGELAHPIIRRQLRRIFRFRHEQMQRLFAPELRAPCTVLFDMNPGYFDERAMPRASGRVSEVLE